MRRSFICRIAKYCCGKFFAITLSDGVDGGQIVITGVHVPNVVAARPRILGSVGPGTDVDDHGQAIGIDNEVAHIIVVVMFPIVPTFNREV